MMALRLALLIVAMLLFALEGFGVKHPRINFIGLGLALWVLNVVLTTCR